MRVVVGLEEFPARAGDVVVEENIAGLRVDGKGEVAGFKL